MNVSGVGLLFISKFVILMRVSMWLRLRLVFLTQKIIGSCYSFRALLDPLHPIPKLRDDSKLVVLKIYFSQIDSAFCDIN